MHWSVDAVTVATAGRLAPGSAATGGGAVGFAAVGTDSRSMPAGGLFVPVRGARDGHQWIRAAVAAGATGTLVEAGRDLPPLAEAVVVEVADTSAALLDLGRAARRRLSGPVVGITGSVGKTSTKDLLAAALRSRWRVAASERSFNNELGVPLTLANAADDTEVAVVEMGARGIGHIALLCDVARPTLGIVTAVAGVHTERFGSLEAVAAAKGELVEALPADGVAVLNADDRRVAAMATRSAATVLRYSAAGEAAADVSAEGVTVGDDLRPRFVLRSPWGDAEVRLAVRGAHQVGNALAAAAAALRCGVPVAEVAGALGSAAISPWRMELARTPAGAVVLNDAYNANPSSVTAALHSLAALPAGRRIAVLGAMTELGPEGADAHRGVGALAGRLGIEVVAVSTDAYGAGTVVAGLEEAEAALRPSLREGVAVLVKGSRVTGLERLAERLVRPA